MKKNKYPYPIKHWLELKAYPKSKEITMDGWAWEFLRRNPKYQEAWDNIKGKHPISGKEFYIQYMHDPEDDDSSSINFYIGQGNMIMIKAHIINPGKMDKYVVIQTFDVRRPIKPQIDQAEQFLKIYQKSIGIKSHSHHKKYFVEYLRILDAIAIGVKPKKIREIILPSSKYTLPEFDQEETYKDRKKRAIEYRDFLYIDLPKPRESSKRLTSQMGEIIKKINTPT